MKDFLKNVLATFVGILLFFLIFGILGVMSLVGMVASTDAATNVKDNSVMVVKLDGAMEERSEGDVKTQLMGGGSSAIGLDDMLTAIRKAKENKNVKGIYLEAGMFQPDSPASMVALRNALLDFKKSGKWIVAYGDQYTQGTYYLCSLADKVWLNPIGMIDWHGMAAEPMFYKDLMAKFGVKMQLAKVGSYKSAPEMFTADKMSDPNREQVTAYITGIWNTMVNDVSASRKISAEQLNTIADNLPMFDDPQNYLKMKLVDKLMYTDEVKGEVKKLLKLKDDDNINQISVAQMMSAKEDSKKGDEIAVYYAYGDIVDKEGFSLLSGGGHQIVGNTVAKDLAELAKDDNVKAVVIRINSGGGSAYASEQIWRAITLLKEKKPVVVSMGGMAASGGYYMSCPANWIVAEPTTLTGSIGIFGMFPDASNLLTQKLGIKFDEIKTNKHSNFGTRCRPFNEEEMSFLNMYIERGYQLFRKRVADGRKQPVEAIEKIAQGRVWLGQDALKIKLVDELGGLDAAVKKAAKLAKADEYHTSAYPAKAGLMDQLMGSVTSGGDNYLDARLREYLGIYYEPFMLMKNIDKQSAIQARIPFELNLR